MIHRTRRRKWAGLLMVATATLAFLWWRRGTVGPQPQLGRPHLLAAREAAPQPRQEGRLSGRVVGPAGQGIGGAIVTLHGRPAARGVLPAIRGPALRTFTTGPDGTFHFESLARGRYLAVARAERLTVGYRDDIEVEPGDDPAQIEIQLWAGGVTLSGRVLDAGGGVIPGGRVRASSYALNAEGTHDLRAFQADVDGEGHYSLQLPPGTHTVSAVADGYAPITRPINLYGDMAKDFVLQPAARISGRVVTLEGGAPVAGVKVSVRREISPDLSGDSTTTDDRGSFVFTPLGPGAYVVTAQTKGAFGEIPRPIVLGATEAVDDLEIAVSATFTVRGRVTSGAGRPVPRALVNLSLLETTAERRFGAPWTSRPGDSARAFADDEGNYQVNDLPPRGYRLAVSAEGYATHIEPISLSADLARDVVLQDAALVSGIVLTSSGQPAARALVRGFVRTAAAGGDESSRSRTDAEGRFSLGGLGGGDLLLVAMWGDEAGVTGPEPLGYGERRDVTIRLGPGASVAGAVSWEDGTPARTTVIVVVSTFADGSRFEVDPFVPSWDGTFSARDIPPGEISVRAVPAGRHLDHRQQQLSSDQVILTLKAGEERSGLKLVIRR